MGYKQGSASERHRNDKTDKSLTIKFEEKEIKILNIRKPIKVIKINSFIRNITNV